MSIMQDGSPEENNVFMIGSQFVSDLHVAAGKESRYEEKLL